MALLKGIAEESQWKREFEFVGEAASFACRQDEAGSFVYGKPAAKTRKNVTARANSIEGEPLAVIIRMNRAAPGTRLCNPPGHGISRTERSQATLAASA